MDFVWSQCRGVVEVLGKANSPQAPPAGAVTDNPISWTKPGAPDTEWGHKSHPPTREEDEL